MKRTCAASAAVCLLSLVFAPRSARAELEVDLTGGGTMAIPAGDGDSYFGPRFALGVRWVFAENHALGILARGHYFIAAMPQQDWNAGVSYRYYLRPSESVSVLFGASAGAGVWPGCVQMNEDVCGGFGAVFGAETGVLVPVHEHVAVTAGLELVGQLGIRSKTDAIVMPGAWVGLSF